MFKALSTLVLCFNLGEQNCSQFSQYVLIAIKKKICHYAKDSTANLNNAFGNILSFFFPPPNTVWTILKNYINKQFWLARPTNKLSTSCSFSSLFSKVLKLYVSITYFIRTL